ncbi:MAG: NUDIX hydrolase [Deltaproteobacteria bacterium]|nr:NUDIX hydrolase [Deltaproteobacteria bacterium]
MSHWHLGPNPTSDMVLIRRRADGGRDVLLIRRSPDADAHPGRWAVPGGFVDTDAPRGVPWLPGRETPAQAVVREVREETGVDVAGLAAAGRVVEIEVRERPGRDPRDDAERWTRTHVFLAVADECEVGASPSGADDAGEAAWIPLDEALALPLAFDHGEMLLVAVGRMSNSVQSPR